MGGADYRATAPRTIRPIVALAASRSKRPEYLRCSCVCSGGHCFVESWQRLTSDFRPATSDLRLPTCDFRPPTSDLRLVGIHALACCGSVTAELQHFRTPT